MIKKIPLGTLIGTIIGSLIILLAFGFQNWFVGILGSVIIFLTIICNIFEVSEGYYNGEFMGLRKTAILSIGIILLISFAYCSFQATTYTRTTTEKYPIYTIDTPFGILWKDTTGSLGGGFIFGCGVIGGKLNTDLVETYNAKFMIGDELNSMKFKADETPLKVDGQFCIEKITTTHYTYNQWFGGETVGSGDGHYGCYATEISYAIHIPDLPDVNSTTSIYKVIG